MWRVWFNVNIDSHAWIIHIITRLVRHTRNIIYMRNANNTAINNTYGVLCSFLLLSIATRRIYHRAQWKQRSSLQRKLWIHFECVVYHQLSRHVRNYTLSQKCAILPFIIPSARLSRRARALRAVDIYLRDMCKARIRLCIKDRD